MAAGPALNARGMRGRLLALEVMPLAMGYGKRFRRLPRAERTRFVHAVEHSSNRHVKQLVKALKGAAFLAYYGDDATEDDIRSFLRERVATYKVPKRVLFFDDGDIPMTGSATKVRDEALLAAVHARLEPQNGAR